MVLEEAKAIRNIYNIGEVNSYIQNVIKDKNINEEKLRLWLERNLKNYIIKEYEHTRLVDNLNEVLEDWAITGIKNKTLQRVVIHEDFKQKIAHVIDFLGVEYIHKRLDTLSVPDAIHQSIIWSRNQKAQEDEAQGRIELMRWNDGFSIQEMISKQSLLYEGYKMSHCIGLVYEGAIVSGKKRAFSLRDKHNNPHVTILYDVEKRIIEEIKGATNTIVKIEYQDYVADFLNQCELPYHKVQDYDYLPNTAWDKEKQEFYVTDKVEHPYHTQFTFQEHFFHSFSMAKKESFKTQRIHDTIHIGQIDNSLHHLKDIQFKSLKISISKRSPEMLDIQNQALKNLTTQELQLLVEDACGDIEISSSYVNIEVKKQAREGSLKTVDLHKAKEVKILVQKGKTLTIDTLILGENLEYFYTDNVIVKNLLIAETHALMIMKNTQIKQANVQAHHTIFSHSQLNDITLKANIIESYDTRLPQNTKVKQFLLSNCEQDDLCDNQISLGIKKITQPNLINSFISSANLSLDLTQAEHFNYIEKNSLNHDLKEETLSQRLIDICKRKYHQDLSLFFNQITQSVGFFENIIRIDVPYLTQKYIRDKVEQYICIRPDFLAFLAKNPEEKLLEQFLLFEHSRILNSKGITLDVMREIINCPLHPYMEKHIQFINQHETYALNEDFNLVINGTSPDKEWSLFYDNVNIRFNEISPEHVFFHLLSKTKNPTILNRQKELDALFDNVLNHLTSFNQFDEIAEQFLSRFSTAELSILKIVDKSKTLFEHLAHLNPEPLLSEKIKNTWEQGLNNNLFYLFDYQHIETLFDSARKEEKQLADKKKTVVKK